MTPRAEHPFGTVNQLIQLEDNFLELVGVGNLSLIPEHNREEFSFGAFNRDYLSEREGFSMIALKSNDWKKDRDRLSAAGVDLSAPFEFSREARQPDGKLETMGFKLSFIGTKRNPKLKFFTCNHLHQRDLFFKKEFKIHKNTAYKIDEVMLIAEDPAEYQKFFKRLVKEENIQEISTELIISSINEQYTISTPSDFLKRFPGANIPVSIGDMEGVGYRILVQDIEITKECLVSKGILFTEGDRKIWLDPYSNFGVLIEFAMETCQSYTDKSNLNLFTS